ncbi:cysteine hydrolase [soil metagenome]
MKLETLTAESFSDMVSPGRTALLVIDVQNDFCAPDGVLGKAGLDMSVLDAPIERIQRLIAAARAAGVTVAFARVMTKAATDSTALKLFYLRQGKPLDYLNLCRIGTSGVDYYVVQPQEGDIEIEKPQYSSFMATQFEHDLRARDIDTLVVTGFTTDCCVDTTVRDAFHRNFNSFVVSDATAAYDDELHAGSLNALSKNCAILVETQDLLDAWQPVD